MDQVPRIRLPRLRLSTAIGLAAVSIVAAVLLITTDGARVGATWAYHSGVSAIPLFLVAGAIAAESIARPPQGRHSLMRFVAIAAFILWGIAQLLSDAKVAATFNDAAVLLFVLDAGAAVICDARATRQQVLAQRTRNEIKTSPGVREAARGPEHDHIQWCTCDAAGCCPDQMDTSANRIATVSAT